MAPNKLETALFKGETGHAKILILFLKFFEIILKKLKGGKKGSRAAEGFKILISFWHVTDTYNFLIGWEIEHYFDTEWSCKLSLRIYGLKEK